MSFASNDILIPEQFECGCKFIVGVTLDNRYIGFEESEKCDTHRPIALEAQREKAIELARAVPSMIMFAELYAKVMVRNDYGLSPCLTRIKEAKEALAAFLKAAGEEGKDVRG